MGLELEEKGELILIRKIQYKIESTRYFGLFLFNLFVCILFLGTFVFNEHLSVDDYALYYQQKQAALTDIKQNLRMVSGGGYYLLDALGINIVSQQMVFGSILIITFAWVITRITFEIINMMEIQKDLEKILFIDGITMILFLNASVSEYLYYAGVYAQWIVGILGFTYGAICISKDKRVLLNGLIATLALVITVGSYQMFLAQYIYVAMTLIYIRNHGEISKKFIVEVGRAIMAAIAAMAINILGCKILIFNGIIDEGSRADFNWLKIPQLVKDIIFSQRSIWIEGMGLYQKGSMAVILFFILGILFWILYRKKTGICGFAFVAGILASGFCVMYMAQIMQGYIRVTNRGMYAVYGIYTSGLWLISYYLFENNWKLVRRFGFCMISAFLVYSSVKINDVAINVMKTNALSRCYIEEIIRRIENYEKQNDRITKIGFCRDASVSYRYYDFIETMAYGDMCANPFLAEWSDINSIRYYTGRDFERVDVPDQVQELCAGINWDEADWDNQLFFDNDAVFICLY